MRTLKAIREALREFDPEATFETASDVLETAQTQGFTLLANAEYVASMKVREKLLEHGIGTALNLDPVAYAERQAARQMTADGASPEAVFAMIAPGEPQVGSLPDEQSYRTAMVLMANMEGNPLKASSVAIGLARTTGEVAFYTKVVASMIVVFPWLEEMLKQQKLLT